jgi:hypothetical protein
MDDSRVGSLDRQTNLIHLEAYYCALATNGLAINLENCVFPVPTLEIREDMILAADSAPMAEHTAAIDSCPTPQDIK